MKFKSLFTTIVAAMAVSSCSSDEPKGKADGDGSINGGNVDINIMVPTERGGRAGEFENGEGEESVIKRALFVFFGESGALSEIVDVNEFTTTSNATGSIEKVAATTLELKGSLIAPTSLVVVLNYNNSIRANIYSNAKSLEHLKKAIGDYSVIEEGNGFVMTNSVYQDKSDVVVCETKLTPDAIYKRGEKPEGYKAVNVYVERVLAKVYVEEKMGGMTITPSDVEITDPDGSFEGTKLKLTPVIKGMVLSCTPQKANAFKYINGINYSWKWNDPDNHRSYWAVTPDDASNNVKYTHYTYNDAVGKNLLDADQTSQVFYTHPNTSSPNVKEVAPNTASKLLLVAELQDENGKAVELVKFKNGMYDAEGYLMLAAKALDDLGCSYSVTEEGQTVVKKYTADMLEIIKATGDKVKAYEVSFKVKDDAMAGITDNTDKPVDEAISTIEHAWMWKNGMSYYYAEILHKGFEGQTEDLHGVVRNHVYKMKLNSMKGLGTPVFDPDDEIDPEKPSDELFFIEADINILRWRIVAQDVNFEW